MAFIAPGTTTAIPGTPTQVVPAGDLRLNPRPFNSRDSWRTSLLLAADLVLDQGVKALVAATLPLGSSVALTPWFNFVHVLNPGAAFSFLADAGGWQRHALSGIGIAVSLALAVLLRRGVRHHLEAAAYVGLIGGALGNVTDRLRIGAVVDYLDLYWRDLHRPAFNLADVFVLGSAGLLALASFKSGVPAAPPGQSDTNRGLASTPFKNIDNGAAEFGRRVSLPGGECDTDAARYPMSIEHPLPQLGGHRVRGLWTPLFLAWLIALLATAGALFLGEVMGMTPCVLCWYQRIAMFPLAVILGVGVLDTDIRCVRYALPFAWAGWGLAGYHCLIFWGVVAEGLVPCGKGSSCADADLQVAGFVPIPLLSLIAFSAIVALLWFAEKRTKT